MNIINKILLVTSFSLVVVGCGDDRLDIDPTTEVPIDTAIKSEEGLESAKNTIYYYFSRTEGFGRDMIVVGDLLSDDSFVTNRNSGRYIRLSAMSYSQAETGFAGDDQGIGAMNRLYDAVAIANNVLNADLPETANVKQIKAEAYVGRALALFYAVNIFSPSIASGINQEFGVPAFTDSYDPNAKYPRNTVAEVYARIESDLQQSLVLFQHEATSKSFFGPTAAKLLLSRVYLYQQKWQQAQDYASQVESAGGTFQAIDKAGYVSYFTTDDAPETVFEIGYSNNNSLGINHIAGIYAKNGAYYQNQFRQSLYDLYDVSDVRKNMFVQDAENVGNNTPIGYFTTKYTEADSYSQNIHIMRMSEATLNKIEAMYHLGNESGAQSELNAFVATRGTYSYSSTGAQLLSDILKERRLEFAGEGHRFFDLKRNMLPIVKDSNCNSNCTVNPTDKLFVLPMGQREMDTNSKMTQYPGY